MADTIGGGRLSSIPDSRWATFVVHVERCHERSRLHCCAIPYPNHQRLNPLTTMQFALSVLVESRSIAVSF